MDYKDKLLKMYKYAINEAQALFLYDYCTSSEEEKKRKQDDEEVIKEFKEILFEKFKDN